MKRKHRIGMILGLILSLVSTTVYAQAGDFKGLFKTFTDHGATVKKVGIDPESKMCIVHVELPAAPNEHTDSVTIAVGEIIDKSPGTIIDAGYVPGSGTYRDRKYVMDFKVNPSFCPGGPTSRPIPEWLKKPPPLVLLAFGGLVLVVVFVVRRLTQVPTT